MKSWRILFMCQLFVKLEKKWLCFHSNETQFSKELKKSFQNYAQFLLAQTEERSLDLLAVHSASSFISMSDTNSSKKRFFHEFKERKLPHLKIFYSGSMGSLPLVSALNSGLKNPVLIKYWQNVVSPHAAFLALFGSGEKRLMDKMIQAESLGKNQPMYSSQWGWMDSYILEGPLQGYTTPSQLSLDQGMLVLSILPIITGQKKLRLSDELLKIDSGLHILNSFYSFFDQQLEKIPCDK